MTNLTFNDFPHSTQESTIFGIGFVVAKGHEVETHTRQNVRLGGVLQI